MKSSCSGYYFFIVVGETVIIVAGETVCRGIILDFGVRIDDLPPLVVEMRVDYCRRWLSAVTAWLMKSFSFRGHSTSLVVRVRLAEEIVDN